jgi:YggT family protein
LPIVRISAGGAAQGKKRFIMPAVPFDALALWCSGPYLGIRKKDAVMLSLFQILMLILDVVWFFIIAHVIMSWLINFQVINMHQPLVAQIWHMLNRVLEPMYQPIRRILPNMQGIDLAPLVALIAVYALRIILANNISAFY